MFSFLKIFSLLRRASTYLMGIVTFFLWNRLKNTENELKEVQAEHEQNQSIINQQEKSLEIAAKPAAVPDVILERMRDDSL